jgi:hypothetical protein
VQEIALPTSGTNPEWPGFFLRASGQESKDGLGATPMQWHDLNNLENLRQSSDSRASYSHELQVPIRILDDGRLSQVILNRIFISRAESEYSP